MSLPPARIKEELLFTETQRGFRDRAKKFADSIPLQQIIDADVNNAFDRRLFESACREGFGGLPFGTEYGGTGGDYVSFCLVNEELARRCCPIMSSLGVHVLCQEPIYRFGTEEQKQKYLPKSSTGEYLAAFGLTEPDAGSDTAAIRSVARKVSGGFVLNGSKVFITSGGSADYVIVMSRLEDAESDLTGSKSISAFIVEKTFPGFKIGQKFDFMGMRGYSTCELVFDECRIPEENLLRKPGSGRTIALSSLAKGRVTIAAQAVGWAQGALDIVAGYLRGEYSDLRNDAGTESHVKGLVALPLGTAYGGTRKSLPSSHGQEVYDRTGQGRHDQSGASGHDCTGQSRYDQSGASGHDCTGQGRHDQSGASGHDCTGQGRHDQSGANGRDQVETSVIRTRAAASAMLGELAVMVESARVLTYEAAAAVDRGQTDALLASMAKLKATDVAMKAASEAMSIVGPDSVAPNLLLERIYRDSKAGQIYEGTNQIQRSLIARYLLGGR